VFRVVVRIESAPELHHTDQLMAKLREVKTQVGAADVELRARLVNAIADGLTLGEIARITQLSETTLTSVRDAVRPGMRRQTREGLRRLPPSGINGDALTQSSAQVGVSEPQFAGYVTQPRSSTSGTLNFLNEAERRGYLRRVLEEARRAISDAERALDASLTGAASDVAADAALVAELGDRARNAGQQTAPGRTAQSK
jgi:hypothetical protein